MHSVRTASRILSHSHTMAPGADEAVSWWNRGRADGEEGLGWGQPQGPRQLAGSSRPTRGDGEALSIRRIGQKKSEEMKVETGSSQRSCRPMPGCVLVSTQTGAHVSSG